MTSEHLLKAHTEMARKTNKQLICLSDQCGESIHNRFDNICVMSSHESGLKPGPIIDAEHYKGEGNRKFTASQIEVFGQGSLLF